MLPVRPVTMPADLAGTQNGRLGDHLLVAIEPAGRLHPLAARAWTAMRAAAAAAGIDLAATSVADTYRSYAHQEAAFRRRYTPTFDPAINTAADSRRWNGARWYKRQGVAALASPGNSNHGWGLAIDVANAHGARLDWLLAKAARFGFSWEIQSEPWHLRYIDAENIPAAVLAYETGTTASAPVVRPTLRRGDTGDHVRYAQTRLNAHGLRVVADGDFGPQTERAVRSFQTRQRLTVDGVIGQRQTWPALEAQP